MIWPADGRTCATAREAAATNSVNSSSASSWPRGAAVAGGGESARRVSGQHQQYAGSQARPPRSSCRSAQRRLQSAMATPAIHSSGSGCAAQGAWTGAEQKPFSLRPRAPQQGAARDEHVKAIGDARTRWKPKCRSCRTALHHRGTDAGADQREAGNKLREAADWHPYDHAGEDSVLEGRALRQPGNSREATSRKSPITSRTA